MLSGSYWPALDVIALQSILTFRVMLRKQIARRVRPHCITFQLGHSHARGVDGEHTESTRGVTARLREREWSHMGVDATGERLKAAC